MWSSLKVEKNLDDGTGVQKAFSGYPLRQTEKNGPQRFFFVCFSLFVQKGNFKTFLYRLKTTGASQ